MNQRFTDQLVHCECCPRKCGVNRLEGKTGFCRIAGEAQISYAGLHYGEGFRQYRGHPYPETPLLQELLGEQVVQL